MADRLPAGEHDNRFGYRVNKIIPKRVFVNMVYNKFTRFGYFAEKGKRILYNFYKVMNVNNLRALRFSKNMRQSDLAILLNCAPITVSRYETGERDIDSETICKLCEIFGCTADYLLGRSLLPTPELSDEEARLLQAYRSCDDRARDMVRLALAPFAQETGSSETA